MGPSVLSSQSSWHTMTSPTTTPRSRLVEARKQVHIDRTQLDWEGRVAAELTETTADLDGVLASQENANEAGACSNLEDQVVSDGSGRKPSPGGLRGL